MDGADLGLLLASWNTQNPITDLNGDGNTDGADLGLLLAAWGPCPPTAFKQYGKRLPAIQMTLNTPAGPRQVFGDAAILYSVGQPNGSGVRPVFLDRLALSLSSTTVFTSDTGGFSMVFRGDTPPGTLSPSGLLSVPISMDVHYWRIDVLHPPVRPVCTEVGGSDGFMTLPLFPVHIL